MIQTVFSYHYIKLQCFLFVSIILQSGYPISLNPCLSFSCVSWCMIALFPYFYGCETFCTYTFLGVLLCLFVHPCVVCMPLHVCVYPIVLRIFDSVYLNVSYRRSWKDMEQETSQVGYRPRYSTPFKHLFSIIFSLLKIVFCFFS